jgi:sterol desaturase/sphingolipid hydroxylase (fatty acid hydroxylase superfamily)
MIDLPHVLTVVVSLTGLSVILSAIGCLVAFFQTGRRGLRNFVRYCFPPDLLCRSCYQDVGFILLKQLARPWTRALIQLVTSSHCALATYALLVFAFGPRIQGTISPILFGTLLLAAVLIQDFVRFGNHYGLHRIGILWDAHKVHHSARFLTPLTNHRAHIIEETIQQAATGLAVGPLLGVTAFVTSTSIARISLLGFDAYALIDTLCFGVLRHSHIGLSFGWLELYLMSPKQHHMHHSVDPRHWDRNFGFLFSFWDRMAGTICYSNPQEKITVGIVSDIADYDSVLKLHFMPYIKMWQRLFPSWPGRRRAIPSSSASPSACSTVRPVFDDDFAPHSD